MHTRKAIRALPVQPHLPPSVIPCALSPPRHMLLEMLGAPPRLPQVSLEGPSLWARVSSLAHFAD